MTELTTLSLDRCDHCGKDAAVKVEFAGGCELFLCADHARQHQARVNAVAILDRTNRGVEPPSALAS